MFLQLKCGKVFNVNAIQTITPYVHKGPDVDRTGIRAFIHFNNKALEGVTSTVDEILNAAREQGFMPPATKRAP